MEPWFVAKDVCEILKLGNARQAVSRLNASMKGVTSNDTLGGVQEMITVSEAGLYKLIFGKRLQTDGPTREPRRSVRKS